MSVEQTQTVDLATVDKDSGDLWLTISDHLSWESEEKRHLLLLQEKINAYLRFIESGEISTKVPESVGRRVVINVAGKFPMSANATVFFRKAIAAIENAGFQLQFNLMRPN